MVVRASKQQLWRFRFDGVYKENQKRAGSGINQCRFERLSARGDKKIT
jgi:hypothetical protein